MKKNIDLDFSLDGENEKTKELNLLKIANQQQNDNNKTKELIQELNQKLDNVIEDSINKSESKVATQKLNEIHKLNQEDTKILQIASPYDLAEIAKHFKEKRTKSYRLQTFITDETFYAIQTWKRAMKIKKDTDAVEALLRLALGLKQI